MIAERAPDVSLDLLMHPQHYWETYNALKRDGVIAQALGEDRLEALARLVRELSQNARHHGNVTSQGKLTGYLALQTFELRLGGPAFNSKKHAAAGNTGGLYSSNAVLNQAGGTWSYRYESGWNVYTIHFADADGDADDMAE